jgi:hypothetical protein
LAASFSIGGRVGFCLKSGVKPPLDHESVDDAVEQRVVEVSRVRVSEEIGDALRGALAVELSVIARGWCAARPSCPESPSRRRYDRRLLDQHALGRRPSRRAARAGRAAAIFLTTSIPSTTLPNTV